VHHDCGQEEEQNVDQIMYGEDFDDGKDGDDDNDDSNNVGEEAAAKRLK
jgi:hypothetical protein